MPGPIISQLGYQNFAVTPYYHYALLSPLAPSALEAHPSMPPPPLPQQQPPPQN